MTPNEDAVQYRDRRRAESFGADAERYDRTRPSYPSGLIEDLLAESPVRVLDVGCGTGKAGRLLVERGCQVLGVEPDPRMAHVARRYGLDIEVATFETWDPADHRFDLVISAQAWHWVNPAQGPAKAHGVLTGSGRLAVFANLYAHEPEIQVVLEDIYSRLAPEFDGVDCLALGRISDVTGRAFLQAIESTRLFKPAERRTYGHEQQYTTEEWLDGLPTFSDHSQLPRERLGALLAAVGQAIDERGGTVTLHYTTDLTIARVR